MKVNKATGEVVLPFIRSAFNYDMDQASDESGLDCSVEPSKTQQQFKDECDINVIVKRFGLGMEMPEAYEAPSFADFTEHVTDYHSAMNLIRESEAAFMTLPAHLRAEFDNNPQRLLEFLEDGNNKAKAVELGLVKAEPAKPEPMEVRVVPDSTGTT